MMYCGTLWGLYHQGWAIKSDEDSFIFPFWLNGVQAHRYAKSIGLIMFQKIKPQDFQTALLPTLKRLNVTPALFSSSQCKFKLSTTQMSHFFLRNLS